MSNPLYGNVAWDSVTILKKKPAPITNKKAAINKAVQQGEKLNLEKKYNAATNRHQGTSMNTAKLDAETEKLSHNKVGLDVARLVQQARSQKGMNRTELARAIGEKEAVVKEVETGEALFNNQILGKIERAVGIKLRGKDKGQPLAPPVPKKAATTAKKSQK